MAAIGIVINATTALLFFREKEKDINIKSAYLHLMSDAIVSAGLIVGGIIIIYTNWFWMDAVLSIVVAFTILFSTWRLLKDSLRLSLDGVPENINVEEIKKIALEVAGIKDLHHLHIWAISTTENALTGHLVLELNISIEEEQNIKHELKNQLKFMKKYQH